LVIFTVVINKISITSDTWTVGKHGLSYSCVTAHYIDHDWILSLLCSTEEWDQLEQLHIFLEVFFNATLQLSCSYIPSAHQLLQHLYLIFKVYFFRLVFILLQILSYFITNLFYFFKIYHDFENIDIRRIAEDVYGDSPLSPIIEAMREKFLKY
jgi:hypothetical protein